MASCDILVIGGGAAGLFCAITAGQRGRRVIVVDHADKIGKKILISGGGRCNFTNRTANPDNYLSSNPHFCRSALARFSPQQFIDLVESHHIAYHEKTLGQLFCDGSAKQIVAMLLAECAAAGVSVETGVSIDRVDRIGAMPSGHGEGGDGDGRFRTTTSNGSYLSEAVVVACGGLSIPTIGATDFGYRIARQFGHAIIPTVPALVPLTLPAHDLHRDLSGVAVDCIASIGSVSFREALLFTHAGLSGPAVLQISSYWSPGTTIIADLAPEIDLEDILVSAKTAGDRALVSTCLAHYMPKRLAQALSSPGHLDRAIVQLSTVQIATIAQRVHAWSILPSGTEGYRKAEVTKGGVDTRELSSQTMESRRVPGLYFIGEVVDVTGWLGGYNFQWAWASGHACGSHA